MLLVDALHRTSILSILLLLHHLALVSDAAWMGRFGDNSRWVKQRSSSLNTETKTSLYRMRDRQRCVQDYYWTTTLAAISTHLHSSLSDDNTASSSPSSTRGSTTSSIDSNSNNILEDSTGHVNRELAERIWNWEQEHRKDQNLPKLDYSVRAGLRLVDQTAREILERNGVNKQDGISSANSDLYSDLVQDGLSALLDAMSHYESDDSIGFEAYAQSHIRRTLDTSFEEDTAPVRLPSSVKMILKEAKLAAKRLRAADPTGAARPSIQDIADTLQVSVDRLQDYITLAKQTNSRTVVSMESTRSIPDPMGELTVFGDDVVVDDERVAAQKKKRATAAAVGDDDSLSNVENAFVEKMYTETSDDSYIQEPQTNAERLSNIIPDLESSIKYDDDTTIFMNEDETIMGMILEDLPKFLSSSLNERELHVVRLAFGLDGDDDIAIIEKPMSRAEIAQRVSGDGGNKISEEQVTLILATAIEKLQNSYQDRYLDHHDDIDNDEQNYDDDQEDTV